MVARDRMATSPAGAVEPRVAMHALLKRSIGRRVHWRTLRDDLVAEMHALSKNPAYEGVGVAPAGFADAAQKLIQEVASGYTGIAEVIEIRGPRRFLRFVGRLAFATWFFDEDVLTEPLGRLRAMSIPADQRRVMLFRQLRQGLAVAINWNSFNELWAVTVPAGETVVGIQGAVRWQSVVTDKSDPRYDPAWRLPGGLAQYYFPLVNPFWGTRVWDTSASSATSF